MFGHSQVITNIEKFISHSMFRNSVHLTEYCAGGKMEKNEMGGACGAYGGGERGVQGSSGET